MTDFDHNMSSTAVLLPFGKSRTWVPGMYLGAPVTAQISPQSHHNASQANNSELTFNVDLVFTCTDHGASTSQKLKGRVRKFVYFTPDHAKHAYSLNRTMDRILERAFAKAYGGQEQAQERAHFYRKRNHSTLDESTEAQGEPTAPDAIRKILDAWSNKEYFRYCRTA